MERRVEHNNADLEKFIRFYQEELASQVFCPEKWTLSPSANPNEQSAYSLSLVLSGRQYRLDGTQENNRLVLAIPSDQLYDIAIELIRLLDLKEKCLFSLFREMLKEG